MPIRCIDCGVKCLPFKRKNPFPRCRSCWLKWIRNNRQYAPAYKKGRFIDGKGYVYVTAYGHPNSLPNGYIAEHRLVMSNHLGRPLLSTEIVHHINEIREDNRIENLQVCSRAEHTVIHKKTSVCSVCGDIERCKGLCEKHYQESIRTVTCAKCGVLVAKDKRSKHKPQLCRECAMLVDRPPMKCKECGKPALAKELCNMHYKRWRKSSHLQS